MVKARNTICDFVARNSTAQNVRYLSADLGSTVTGTAAAIVTSNYIQHMGLDDGADSIGTYVAKTAVYLLTYMGTHRFVGEKQKAQINLDEELVSLMQSNIKVTGVHSLLTVATHYAAISLGVLPKNIAAAVIYPLIGTTCFAGKHVMNWRKGLFRIKKG